MFKVITFLSLCREILNDIFPDELKKALVIAYIKPLTTQPLHVEKSHRRVRQEQHYRL